MCGIGAVVSLRRFPLSILLDIVHAQIERGQQGTGVAWSSNGLVFLLKEATSPSVFEVKYAAFLDKVTTRMAVIHHRLPSHGDVKYENTHPFMSCPKSPLRFAFCHNGTWLGCDLYRERLMGDGHIFQGETDTEVLMHLAEDMIVRGHTLYDAICALDKFMAGVVVALAPSELCVSVTGFRMFYLGKTEFSYIMASTKRGVQAAAAALGETLQYTREVRRLRIRLVQEDGKMKIVATGLLVKPGKKRYRHTFGWGWWR